MNICIFGDSIAWGANDFEQGGWVNRLQNYFLSQELAVDNDVDVYNLGVSGDNTEDLIKRFTNEAIVREANVVVFAIGVNDSQVVIPDNQNRVPIEAFENNIRTLIAEAKKITNIVLFIGTTSVDESKTVPVPWNTDKKYLNSEIEKYNLVIKTISQSEGLLYVDLKGVLVTGDLSDGLHPNPEGHKKMFETIKPFIENLIGLI